MHPKIVLDIRWAIKKERVGGLTSVVQIILTKGCRLVSFQVKIPRIQTADIVWGLLVSSVRKLLEKIGDLRAIAILVKLNLGILDIH